MDIAEVRLRVYNTAPCVCCTLLISVASPSRTECKTAAAGNKSQSMWENEQVWSSAHLPFICRVAPVTFFPPQNRREFFLKKLISRPLILSQLAFRNPLWSPAAIAAFICSNQKSTPSSDCFKTLWLRAPELLPNTTHEKIEPDY